MTSVYDSERPAAVRLRSAPVHEQILRSARLGRQADRALDMGCGAGLSTAALAPLARRVIGLDRSLPCSPTRRVTDDTARAP
jgi:protein-L-isoaspartate O-methyltransferase